VTSTGSEFDDPDRAVQIEDDNPETLAGEPVDFDPDTPDPSDDVEPGGVMV
jgi:hypothetical protein